jgi:hypothetical protein
MEMNKELIVSDIQRIEYPDERWYCPNCGREAFVRIEYGERIVKCEDCGEFVVSMVLDI